MGMADQIDERIAAIADAAEAEAMPAKRAAGRRLVQRYRSLRRWVLLQFFEFRETQGISHPDDAAPNARLRAELRRIDREAAIWCGVSPDRLSAWCRGEFTDDDPAAEA